ncbi:protein Hook homolog, partial [Sycon ciliatum]|uniref:protein Hook homolog n=1 Tax=Sycon ciliatum TaxID=27933 RepID=UPI0031F5F3BE
MSSINPGAGGGAKPRRSLPNADGDVDADATTAAAEPGPNQELQDQTARMRMQVETLRKKCAELQKINLELQEESQKIRVESGELMSYIQKKTQRRQSMVVTLNDKNMKELADIAESKTQMIEEFYMKEAAIRASIMAKESTLSDIRKEMDELNYLRVLRDHQAKEIKDLEAEVEAVKLGNKEQQHDMKHAYLQKRKVFEDEAEEKITKMKQEAKQ